MDSAIKPLGQVQLGTALTTVYTAPAQPPNMKTKVTSIWICNTGADGTVTIRYGTGTLTAANSIFDGTAIEAHNVYNVGSEKGLGIILNAGDKIQGLADAANKITVSVFGEEIT